MDHAQLIKLALTLLTDKKGIPYEAWEIIRPQLQTSDEGHQIVLDSINLNGRVCYVEGGIGGKRETSVFLNKHDLWK